MTDPFLHDDAVYVLGALDEPERAAFEAHLLQCPDCSARVRAAAPLAQLLAEAPPEAFGAGAPGPPVPDGLLPHLRRRAAAERRRTRRRTQLRGGVLTALVAACAAVLAFVLWPAGPTTPPSQAPQQFRPVAATSLRANAELVAKPWGTQIDVECWYEHDYVPPPGAGTPGAARSGAEGPGTYHLVVLDGGGARHPAGSWRMPPGLHSRFTGGTDVPRQAITGIQIMADGRAVLVLPLR